MLICSYILIHTYMLASPTFAQLLTRSHNQIHSLTLSHFQAYSHTYAFRPTHTQMHPSMRISVLTLTVILTATDIHTHLHLQLQTFTPTH